MTAVVRPDPGALAAYAAEWLVDTLAALPGRVSVALSGGSTPKATYEALAQPELAARMPWERVHLFWGDERFVPHADARSNFRMVREALLAHVPVPPGNVHPMPTEGMTADDAASLYEAELRRFHGAGTLQDGRPLFDVALMGLGTDGHTASLFPDMPVLQEREAWAAAVIPAGEVTRITLTYPALQSCRHAVFLVAGAEKRDVLARVRAGDAALPAAAYHPRGKLHWFTDQAATG